MYIIWIYIINTREIPSELSRENFISSENNLLPSHVKRSPSLWLDNKSRLFHLWDIELNTPLEDKIHIHARACNILYIIIYSFHKKYNFYK